MTKTRLSSCTFSSGSSSPSSCGSSPSLSSGTSVVISAEEKVRLLCSSPAPSSFDFQSGPAPSSTSFSIILPSPPSYDPLLFSSCNSHHSSSPSLRNLLHGRHQSRKTKGSKKEKQDVPKDDILFTTPIHEMSTDDFRVTIGKMEGGTIHEERKHKDTTKLGNGHKTTLRSALSKEASLSLVCAPSACHSSSSILSSIVDLPHDSTVLLECRWKPYSPDYDLFHNAHSLPETHPRRMVQKPLNPPVLLSPQIDARRFFRLFLHPNPPDKQNAGDYLPRLVHRDFNCYAIEKVFTAEEFQELAFEVEKLHNRKSKSRVDGADEIRILSRERTSLSGVLNNADFLPFLRRVSSVIGIPVTHFEPLQVVGYTNRDMLFKLHHDSVTYRLKKMFARVGKESSSSNKGAGSRGVEEKGNQLAGALRWLHPAMEFEDSHVIKIDGREVIAGEPFRIFTMLVYLNTLSVKNGGATSFPWAVNGLEGEKVSSARERNPTSRKPLQLHSEWQSPQGYKFLPRVNTAVAWSNITNNINGDIVVDPRVVHSADRLTETHDDLMKYAVNVWGCNKAMCSDARRGTTSKKNATPGTDEFYESRKITKWGVRLLARINHGNLHPEDLICETCAGGLEGYNCTEESQLLLCEHAPVLQGKTMTCCDKGAICLDCFNRFWAQHGPYHSCEAVTDEEPWLCHRHRW